MKKIVRYAVLLLFWGSTFALVAAAVHYKKKMALLDEQETAETAEADSTADGTPRPSGEGVPESESGGGAAKPRGSKQEPPANDLEPSTPDSAAQRSDALFERPATIDPGDFNTLIEDLKTAKADYQRRQSALTERERDLDRKEQELNSRENQVMSLARGMAEGRPPPVSKDAAPAKAKTPALNPAGLQELAEFYDEVLSKTKDPAKVKDALLAMKPEQTAAILRAMDKKAGVAVLSAFPLEKFQEISAIILANDGAGNQP